MKHQVLAIGCLLIVLTLAGGVGAEPSAKEHFNSGSVKYLMGDLDGAEKELRAALAEQPSLTGASQLLKSVLREKAKLLSPPPKVNLKERLVKEYIAAGKAHFGRNDFSEAIVFFRAAQQADPFNAEARQYLAQIQQTLKLRARIERQQLWLSLISLVVGLAALVVMLRVVASLFRRRSSRTPERRIGIARRCARCHAPLAAKADFCQNCGARLGSNIWEKVSTEQAAWYKSQRWSQNPFSLDIFPELLTGYQREIKMILEKISAESGHILITGPLGIGKTTLLRWLANSGQDFHAVYISRPPLDFGQVIKLIAQSLGLSPEEAARYDIYSLDELRRQINKNLVLLLDEAHEFTIEIERPLRTLGDLDRVKLVMAGLPEATEKFREEIKPLYQRLVLAIKLDRLDNTAMGELIKVRIENAGGRGTEPFTDDALDRIMALAEGNPRAALKICDRAVTRAINANAPKIDVGFIEPFDKEGTHVQG